MTEVFAGTATLYLWCARFNLGLGILILLTCNHRAQRTVWILAGLGWTAQTAVILHTFGPDLPVRHPAELYLCRSGALFVPGDCPEKRPGTPPPSVQQYIACSDGPVRHGTGSGSPRHLYDGLSLCQTLFSQPPFKSGPDPVCPGRIGREYHGGRKGPGTGHNRSQKYRHAGGPLFSGR